MTTSGYPKHVTGIVVEHFGDWRDARVARLPMALPGPGEVLIGCEAAAVNFQDLLMIQGKYQLRPALPFIAGRDVAGRVVAIGPGVEGCSVGQRVAALVQYGGFADFSLAQAGACFPIPDSLDFARAAASTSVFATAVVALSIRGNLRAGERILITGAAGGVGIAAIQYARQAGAEPIALVSSQAKEQLAKRAGAGHVVRLDQLADPREDLRQALTGVAGGGVDMVVDMVSGDVFDGAIRCLRPGGRIVVVGFASGRIAEAKTNYILLKGLSVIGSALKIGLENHGDALREAMRRVYRDVAAGELDPFITATFPLHDFHRAAALIADRRAMGKIVLLAPQPGDADARTRDGLR
jgi:NADPH2:quinone reductase